jgi:hypothetical protein
VRRATRRAQSKILATIAPVSKLVLVLICALEEVDMRFLLFASAVVLIALFSDSTRPLSARLMLRQRVAPSGPMGSYLLAKRSPECIRVAAR